MCTFPDKLFVFSLFENIGWLVFVHLFVACPVQQLNVSLT